MATAVVSGDTEFEAEISRLKSEIETRFRELIACVRERERELLNQLEEMSTAHRKESEKQQQSISEMEIMLKLTRENIHSENLKDLQDSIVDKIKEKRKEFDPQIERKHMRLSWDDSVFDLIRKLGVLDATCVDNIHGVPVVDCTGKVKPVVNTGTRGGAEGQFSSPWGVSVDYKSGNIYVADQFHHRVQVFDSEGKYLYKFGDIAGDGKMNYPLYIAFTDDRVLVSQCNAGCLLLFDLRGNFIRQIGIKGNRNGQFYGPNGITVNELNGDVYVCDRDNNRVQIFSKDFSYKSQFAVHQTRDIKLTTQHIHVLTASSPFFFTFDYNHTQVLQNMSLSISKHLKEPFAFCIDGAGKFFISDSGKNLILTFDKHGNFLSQLDDASIKTPRGICIDKKGRIVVSCQKPCLLIF